MRPLFPSALLALVATAAFADTYEAPMRDYVSQDVKAWLSDPQIVSAVRRANRAHAALSADDITALDLKWRAELGQDSAPTIDPVANSATSDFLKERVDAAGGVITEILVMDSRGLNVAVSTLTSDYWQGDEAKYTETYGKGPDAWHVSEIDYDESTQLYQAQVSLTLIDPATSTPIGAATIGLNAEAF